jgi:hypothetical protein
MSNQQPIPPVTFPPGEFEQILLLHESWLNLINQPWEFAWIEDEKEEEEDEL